MSNPVTKYGEDYTLQGPGSETLEYEMAHSRGWVVSYWNDDGGCELACFTGPDAED